MTRPNTYPMESNWRLLLKDLGVRPADLFRRADLPDDLLNRSEVRLTTEEYFRLWESLEEAVDDPLFPLRLGEAISTEMFQPAIFAALSSADLATAVERISRFKRLVAPMDLDVRESDETLLLGFSWRDVTAVPPRSLVASELVFLVELARIATREEIEPLRVETTVPPRPAEAYEDYFGVPVETGEGHLLAFSAADAHLPFLTANESMWASFEPDLRRRLAQLDAEAGFDERVRAVLLESLPSGQSSMAVVAERLAVSKRTLQRRLSDEGASFQAILDRTREDLARHYLTNTQRSNAEISFLLGFEDPNSFFRAFQDWTGRTPGQLRQSAG